MERCDKVLSLTFVKGHMTDAQQMLLPFYDIVEEDEYKSRIPNLSEEVKHISLATALPPLTIHSLYLSVKPQFRAALCALGLNNLCSLEIVNRDSEFQLFRFSGHTFSRVQEPNEFSLLLTLLTGVREYLKKENK